jgi:hypothetical protein
LKTYKTATSADCSAFNTHQAGGATLYTLGTRLRYQSEKGTVFATVLMIKLAIWYSATPNVASGHKRVFELFFEKKRAADHIVKQSTMHVMMKLAMMGELSKYWQHAARVVVLAMMAQNNAFNVFT